MSGLDVLRNMGNLAEELKNSITPKSYWIKEQKYLDKMSIKNKKFSDSIKGVTNKVFTI